MPGITRKGKAWKGGKENPTDNKSVGSHERRRVEKELSFCVSIIVKMFLKKFHPAKRRPPSVNCQTDGGHPKRGLGA
jgi:hypothetical protein